MTAQDQMTTPPGPFPIAATIAGVEVVTIPLAEYAELIECRRRLADRPPPNRFAVPPRSPDVAAFFMERFGKTDVMEIIRQCRERFGAERTPSRTSAYAYWQRLRQRAARGEDEVK